MEYTAKVPRRFDGLLDNRRTPWKVNPPTRIAAIITKYVNVWKASPFDLTLRYQSTGTLVKNVR
jgi:hypothetical protein